jgi:TrmH family RNA methyltransferase
MITSTGNARIRRIVQLKRKAKIRREEKCFVAEGLRLWEEIPGPLIRELYLSESFARAHKDQMGDRPYEIVSDEVFRYMSDTQTPQGILGVVSMLPDRSSEIFAPGGLWLMLEKIQDPGNLGTMFRTAEGAGVTGIIMDPATADIYAPKTVRATMGSLFRVPFLIAGDLSEAAGRIRSAGGKIYAANLAGSQVYDTADYVPGTAFLIGNEGSGLTEEAIALADANIRIPMEGRLESLNAAVASAILMYEAGRQRRNYTCFNSGQKKSHPIA